ncbi:hypothetical protein K523DRAFT_225557 [Schizophyllum commune Tattone D]|nr:hypothetical protein K523DRAFT_225557 [Schizophyllum commune Tattone D]
MSSTFPSSDPRGWWPSKPNAKDPARRPTPEKRDSQSKVPGNKFNTLASALGLKSTKRPPALAIEQPPPALQSPLSPRPPKKYANRPPSKSVSSTRSRTDSIEPRTPPDLYQDPVGKRQSLLTLSDLDPFAARGIATPHSPSDPNRLSAYSNTSVPEYVSKKLEARGPTHRSSYASSSSTYTGDTGSSPTTMSPVPSADGHPKIPNARLPGNLHRKASLLSGDGTLGSAWENISSNMHSSQTLKEPRLSQPDPTTLITRPPTRPRGMTDVGTSLRHKFVPRDDAVPKVAPPAHVMPRTSPRVVVRQASASRIVAGPSTAPPAAELPPPPTLPADDADFASNSIHQYDSPDDMFFASPTSWDGRPLSPREREKRPWERDFQPLGGYEIDRSLPSSSRSSGSQPSRTLKKSISHQALVKKSPAPTVPTPPPERDADRQPRKQRSFHHPRTPLSSPQTTNASLPGTPDASTADHRRSGPGSTRKRLFSGSSMRRPSTSQGPETDEDVRSVFSLPLAAEHVQRAPLSLSAFHQPSSFWDEGPSEPSRPTSPPSTQQQQQQQQQEYTPQHIMSPADMLKVEASMALEEEAERQPYIRQRGNSILSSSTCLSDETGEEEYPPSVHRLTAVPSRSTSMVSRKSTGSVPQVSRPSTATNSSAASFRQRSEEQLFLSPQALPPPPRRNRPSTRQGPPAPPAPGPPPPETEAEASEAVDGFSPLSPPPRKILSAKKSMERVTQRRSIMRKPSFLSFDVEDEDDASDGELETDSINHIFEGAGDTQDSFLDLARESFDSTRSDYE